MINVYYTFKHPRCNWVHFKTGLLLSRIRLDWNILFKIGQYCITLILILLWQQVLKLPKINTKQFQSIAHDILERMKQIEKLSDVDLVSEDRERILAHKVVLASASKIFMKMFQTYGEDEDHQVISIRGVQ